MIRGALDLFLRLFSLEPFRCRGCRARFYRFRTAGWTGPWLVNPNGLKAVREEGMTNDAAALAGRDPELT
ncbi:MAG: hypothetical protein HY235_11630 [Acidobacteria bacterium]|nr:hypothetical protein [Acidobacteriota bacterium]